MAEEGKGMDSTATILDLGDDMVIEILVRLRPESIFQYLSVSKKLNSLLTSPKFLSQYSRRFHHRRRTQSQNLLGSFFLHPEFTLEEYNSSEDDDDDLGPFITSSNGLVLCGSPRSYHILNPTTRKHVSLPPPRRNYHLGLSIGLSCDDGDDHQTPRYEVVIADTTNKLGVDNKLWIETYSSETKEWRKSVLVAASNFKLIKSCPPTVVNGVFYWWAVRNLVAVYDPHHRQSGNRDGGNHLQLIQLPAADPAAYVYDHPVSSHVLSQTPDDGRLIFGRASRGVMRIWELSKGELGFWGGTTIAEKEWVPIYQVPCEVGLELVGVTTWDPLSLMVRLGRRDMFQYYPETEVMKLPDQSFFEPTSFSSYLLP